MRSASDGPRLLFIPPAITTECHKDGNVCSLRISKHGPLGGRYRALVLVLQRPSGAVFLTLPATTPIGSLEQVAGLIAHQAARGDSGAARQFLRSNLHAQRDDRRLHHIRTEAARMSRSAPTPPAILAALELVDETPQLTDDGIRRALHACGLSDGEAGRDLVLGLAALFGLTESCTRPEAREVLALAAALRSMGVTPTNWDWSARQVRALRLRGIVVRDGWAVQRDDQRSRLANAVARFLSVRMAGTPEQLLGGATKGLSGMAQRHRLPTVEGMTWWTTAQDWLVHGADDFVRSRIELPLTLGDAVLRPLLVADPTVRRVALIRALVVAGYTPASARVSVQRAPYLAR